MHQSNLAAAVGQMRLLGINAQWGTQMARQIVTLAGNIQRNILPEVVILQGGANGVALRHAFGIGHAVQVQHQKSDRVGRKPGVIGQFRPICIHMACGGVAHILLKGADQIVQGLRRQGMALHGGLQGAHDVCPGRIGRRRCCRIAYRLQSLAVGRQRMQPLRAGGVAFIGQIVCGACETVQRHHGRADVPGAQPTGYGKVFVVGGRVVVVSGSRFVAGG